MKSRQRNDAFHSPSRIKRNRWCTACVSERVNCVQLIHGPVRGGERERNRQQFLFRVTPRSHLMQVFPLIYHEVLPLSTVSQFWSTPVLGALSLERRRLIGSTSMTWGTLTDKCCRGFSKYLEKNPSNLKNLQKLIRMTWDVTQQ